ncbi:hypothetical protein ACFL1H_01775 [Nanoarchaeota archaeon]
MGYDISTPFKDQVIRDLMIIFIRENLRGWEEVISEYGMPGEKGFVDGPLKSKTEDNLHLITLHNRTPSRGREYAYRICSWVAVQEGHKKLFEDINGEKHSLNYIIYESDEDIPLVPKNSGIEFDNTKIEFGKIDENGFYPVSQSIIDNSVAPYPEFWDQANEAMENELTNLSDSYGYDKSRKYREMFDEIRVKYGEIFSVINILDNDMPLTTDNKDEILNRYYIIYGKCTNNDGTWSFAEDFDLMLAKAGRFKGILDMDGFVQRITKARDNLENAVKNIDEKVITELGYEIQDHNGHLLLYCNKVE